MDLNACVPSCLCHFLEGEEIIQLIINSFRSNATTHGMRMEIKEYINFVGGDHESSPMIGISELQPEPSFN